MAPKNRYNRILLKLSGEMFAGQSGFGIDKQQLLEIATALKNIQAEDLSLGVVLGGGNLFRGSELTATGIARTPADQMGMLATLMNGVAVQQALLSLGADVCMMSALECPRVTETYHWQTAINYLEQGKIILFVGGTGNPFFTTDTAAALRAKEIGAEILLKATKVDGIYNKDPNRFKDAVRYDQITYQQAIREELKIMDATAFALCMSESIPIFVFNMEKLLNLPIKTILTDPSYGTLVKKEFV